MAKSEGGGGFIARENVRLLEGVLGLVEAAGPDVEISELGQRGEIVWRKLVGALVGPDRGVGFFGACPLCPSDAVYQ